MVNHGMNIDIRHVMLLADLMTFKVLATCSFFDKIITWSLLLLAG